MSMKGWFCNSSLPCIPSRIFYGHKISSIPLAKSKRFFVRAQVVENKGMRCIWRSQLHKTSIRSLLFHPDDEGQLFLASSSTDGLLRITKFNADFTKFDNLEEYILQGNDKGTPVFCLATAYDLVFAGTSGKEVVAWRKGDWRRVDVKMGGHSGWVRDVAVHRNIAFSAACNVIKVWELTGAFDQDEEGKTEGGTVLSVTHMGDIEIYRGDIMTCVVGNQKLYCGTADGILHSWNFPEDGKKLSAQAFQKCGSIGAHHGRISSLVYEGGNVVSAGHDGCIRIWDGSNLQLIAEACRAHNGEKVNSLTTTKCALLTGGADNAIRKWDFSLNPSGEPTLAHNVPVRRVLASRAEEFHTGMSLLVSGGADGEVCLWLLG